MVFSEYHWPVYEAGRCANRKPEISLWTGHHELQVIRRLARGLRPCPRYAGNASVLNAATAALFDLHLQLQVEVPCFVAAIDDVIVALRLALERFAYHHAVFDAPDAGICVPSAQSSYRRRSACSPCARQCHTAAGS